MNPIIRAACHPSVVATLLISTVIFTCIANSKFQTNRSDNSLGKPLDAIIVLSGGHTNDSRPPEWTVRRVEKAYELLMRHGEPYPKIVCVGGGGAGGVKPMLNKYGFWLPECTLCSEYLHEKKNVSYDLLLREYSSHDTPANGFFSLLNHALPAGWSRLAVVTSSFHMPRARVIFEYMYGLPGAGVGHGTHSKWLGSKAQGFHLEYHEVSDEGLDETALEARKKLEKHFIEEVRVLSKKCKTLPQLHRWFMVDNGGYNTANQHLYGKKNPNQNFSGGGLY